MYSTPAPGARVIDPHVTHVTGSYNENVTFKFSEKNAHYVGDSSTVVLRIPRCTAVIGFSPPSSCEQEKPLTYSYGNDSEPTSSTMIGGLLTMIPSDEHHLVLTVYARERVPLEDFMVQGQMLGGREDVEALVRQTY